MASPQDTTHQVTAIGTGISPTAVRAAAERAQRDLATIYETQITGLAAGEQHAISTARFVCSEIVDGDRRVI